MDDKQSFPQDVFTSLKELLAMEHLSKNFSLLACKQKVKSILGGRHASKLRGRGLDFEEVRQYVKGDDIRKIDWRVTARTKTTHTRVFTEEKEKPALIVVDQSASVFFGSQKRTKAVVAAELAAMAAFRILKQGDRVGGVVVGNTGVDIVFPKRDRRNIVRLFEKIVDRNHELANTSQNNWDDALKDTFQKVINIVTHDFLVIVISDFHRYAPEVTRFISRVAQHNDVILAKVSDPMERDIPDTKFIAGDEETQVAIDGKSKTLKEKFSAGFDQGYRDFENEMKKFRIPLFSVDTIRSLEEQLKEIFSGQKS